MPISMNLKNVPEDVNRIILKEQGAKKAICGSQFSKQSTIFMIIREYNKIKNGDTFNTAAGKATS
ncbi:MAG: hypothetical protein K1X55_17510 [Chitinophagales bacterium]|nr:hypothetical protein [Chitinophagales bacterium]